LGRPIAALLEQCAELLGVDLVTLEEAAANVEPYVRADDTRIWSLMQLDRQLRPEAYGRRRAVTSTVVERSSTYSYASAPTRITATCRSRGGPRHHLAFP
jgi:hypothetical protein